MSSETNFVMVSFSSQRIPGVPPTQKYSWGEIIGEVDGKYNIKIKKEETGSDENDHILESVSPDQVIFVSENDLSGFADLKYVSNPHESVLLQNLRHRFQHGQYNTLLGTIVISVNPNIRTEHNPLYDETVMSEMIQKRNEGERAAKQNLTPHPYQIAENAYQSLCWNKTNQSIVVLGDSGSGKSEIIRSLLDFFCRASILPPDHRDDQRLFYGPNHVCTVFESFGNAKTEFNDNATRMAKWFQVKYNDMQECIGTTAQIFLLEKARVTSTPTNESNFHIFYQTLIGCRENEDLRNKMKIPDNQTPPNFFDYLKNTSFSIDQSKFGFSKLVHALEVLGFSVQERNKIFSTVMSVLWIGNVQFSRKNDNEIFISTPVVLGNIKDLLEIDVSSLESILIFKPANETPEKHYNSITEAQTIRDLVAQYIYEKLLSWIVVRSNFATSLDRRDKSDLNRRTSLVEDKVELLHIGVLDMFGFEAKVKNSNNLGNLMVNYASEKLSQVFLDHNLKSVKREYKEEGISLSHILVNDNDNIIHILEKEVLSQIGDSLDSFFSKLSDATENSTDISSIIQIRDSIHPMTPIKSPSIISKTSFQPLMSFSKERESELNKISVMDLLLSQNEFPTPTKPKLENQDSVLNSSTTTIGSFNDQLRSDVEKEGSFLINHSIGPVNYTVNSSDYKNNRELHDTQLFLLSSLLQDSKNDFVAEIAKSQGNSSVRRQTESFNTKTQLFCSDLKELLELVTGPGPNSTHYMRCFRSNRTLEKMLFDPSAVLSQMNTCGPLSSLLQINQQKFEARFGFENFLMVYKNVIPPTVKFPTRDFVTNCQIILDFVLNNLHLTNENGQYYFMGNQLIFVSKTVMDYLHHLSLAKQRSIISIQSTLRMFTARKKLFGVRPLLRSVVIVQAFARTLAVMKKYKKIGYQTFKYRNSRILKGSTLLKNLEQELARLPLQSSSASSQPSNNNESASVENSTVIIQTDQNYPIDKLLIIQSFIRFSKSITWFVDVKIGAGACQDVARMIIAKSKVKEMKKKNLLSKNLLNTGETNSSRPTLKKTPSGRSFLNFLEQKYLNKSDEDNENRVTLEAEKENGNGNGNGNSNGNGNGNSNGTFQPKLDLTPLILKNRVTNGENDENEKNRPKSDDSSSEGAKSTFLLQNNKSNFSQSLRNPHISIPSQNSLAFGFSSAKPPLIQQDSQQQHVPILSPQPLISNNNIFTPQELQRQRLLQLQQQSSSFNLENKTNINNTQNDQTKKVSKKKIKDLDDDDDDEDEDEDDDDNFGIVVDGGKV
eukprot:c21515_g1_i2.p1 GENE.c21515_g1_i2~~c21515_g1_i2.p1  ORF type:complete len:1285 (-),score=457.48 c21515_g1_i2:338-4192(-)